MLETYPATLRANQIEWSGDAPAHLPPDQAVPVHVTLLGRVGDLPVLSEQGARMAAALESLAAMRALATIPDAAAWEREARQDRVLPGRDQ